MRRADFMSFWCKFEGDFEECIGLGPVEESGNIFHTWEEE